MDLLFGRYSFVIEQVDHATHCDLMRTYNLFVTRIFYIVDVMIQINFRSAQQVQLQTVSLNFSSMYEDVIQNRILKFNLPSSITSSKK